MLFLLHSSDMQGYKWHSTIPCVVNPRCLTLCLRSTPYAVVTFSRGQVSPSYPFQRIDLIFARNLGILDVTVVGNNPPFPLDHSGMVTTLQIEK
jgi:hypothetical protein